MPPILVRSTNAQCMNCDNNLSEYSHRYCFKCAPKGSEEFAYFHERCPGFNSNTYTITNPLPVDVNQHDILQFDGPLEDIFQF